MKLSRILLAQIFCLAMLLLVGCAPTTQKLIFAGESDPADFSLSNTKPEVFAFEIPADAAGPFDFGIELTYFENQMQDWTALPLYYTLTRPDGKEEDKEFSLNLKDEKGGWRGLLLENQTDRRFEENFAKGISLPAGKYELRLFGNSKDLSKPILGIVHVTFKVLAN